LRMPCNPCIKNLLALKRLAPTMQMIKYKINMLAMFERWCAVADRSLSAKTKQVQYRGVRSDRFLWNEKKEEHDTFHVSI